MIEKDIIKDQKETIHRLQEECKEKTDIIMALEQENEKLKDNLKSQQMINLKQQEIALDYWNALEKISRRVQLENADDCLLDIMDIINEVLND